MAEMVPINPPNNTPVAGVHRLVIFVHPFIIKKPKKVIIIG